MSAELQGKEQGKAPAGAAAGGLASVAEIEALADQLSACADDLHQRVMKEINSYKGRPVPDKVQALARALIDDEAVLRERANGLYADAATIVVKSLGKSQQQVVALTVAAADKIRRIALIGDVAGLVGGLLGLAGAAATGHPAPIVLALENIRKQLKAIDAHRAKKPG